MNLLDIFTFLDKNTFIHSSKPKEGTANQHMNVKEGFVPLICMKDKPMGFAVYCLHRKNHRQRLLERGSSAATGCV